MEELTLYKSNNLVFYTSTESEIIKAIKGLIISQIAPVKLITEFKTLIKATYFKAGFAIKGSNETKIAEQTLLLSEAFMFEALKEYPNITIDEIKIAFRKGVLKEYGEYMGLSVVIFMTWIKMYQNDRREAIHKQKQYESKMQSANNTEITEEEKEAILKKGFSRLYAEFKAGKYNKTGYINDIGNGIYDYLDSKGEIKFTPSEKKEFMTAAKLILTEENNPYNGKDLSQKQSIQTFLKSIETNGNNKQLIIMAKKIALYEHFKLINNG